MLPVIMLAAATAHAASDTWSTTGGSLNWNSTADWGGIVPGSTDNLIFGGPNPLGTTLTNDLTSGTAWIMGGITFNSGEPAYVINSLAPSNSFTLSGSVTNNSTSLQTINCPFSLSGTQSFNTTFGGGDLWLGGIISGTGSLYQAGPGTLTLTGSNTYSGTTYGRSGTLVVPPAAQSPPRPASISAVPTGSCSSSPAARLPRAQPMPVSAWPRRAIRIPSAPCIFLRAP